jgi:hypothetical protein
MVSVAAALVLTASVVAQGQAQEKCRPVVGNFEARVLPPAECAAILCTEGRVWGGLQGSYKFKMTTLQPSGVGAIMFFTGVSEVTVKSGDLLFGADTGSVDLGPAGGFASLITFSGGSGDLQNATGQIRLRGQLDPVEETTSGDYIGSICTP